MKRQFLIIIAIIAFMWAGCTDDKKGGEKTGSRMYFSAVISDPLTKADESGFGAGNMVGVYVVDYTSSEAAGVLSETGNRATNIKHWQSAAGLSSDIPIMWGESKQVDIYGYYPYANATIMDVTQHSFSVIANQQSSADYNKSDFLWTKVAATPQQDPIKLTFKHLLSKLEINLKSDASVPGALIDATIRVLGVDTAAIINLTNGEVKPGVIPALNNVQMYDYVEANDGYEMSYAAILVPQTVSAGKHFLEITTVAGHVYNYNLTDAMTFPAGYMLPLNVTLKSGELLVEVGDITDWGVNESVVVGDAEVAKPFAIGDFYNEGGVQGIVFEVDATGEHGKIVSVDEGAPSNVWATENSVTDATSKTDGMSNTNILKSLDPTLAKFPALKWCDDKNQGGITGWYMPASDELKSLCKAFKTFGNTKPDMFGTKFNNAIMATGLPGAKELNWTSSYNSSSERDLTRAFNVSFMSDSGGEESWQKTRANGIYIRAVYAF